MAGFFFSPLERFDILPLYFFNFCPLDLTITNQIVMLVLLCIFLNILLFSSLNKKDYTLHVRSTRCQSILEIFYS